MKILEIIWKSKNGFVDLDIQKSLNEFELLEAQAEVFGRYTNDQDNIYSDGTLSILSSNLVPKFQVFFRNLFPYSLSTMTFDATQTDQEYFTADVSFKYAIYTITDMNNKPL